jgi:hypothetical protein
MNQMTITDYLSPTSEASVLKGIPIAYRDTPEISNLMQSGLYSIKYRGGSKTNYRRPQSHTLREHSDSFAVYPYSTHDAYKTLRSEYGRDVVGMIRRACYVYCYNIS